MLYYTRGIANERAGDWAAAEADFREALALEPDQPLVLNYLGYCLVEKHENLDEALGMIEKAAKAEPEDGYITDSLGWVSTGSAATRRRCSRCCAPSSSPPTIR